MVHAAYQTHLGQDYFFAPRATLADGVIWLLIAKAGITRANLVQVSIVSLTIIKKKREGGKEILTQRLLISFC